VGVSFNSLIPQNCNKNLRKKLLRFFLRKFAENPFLHDKVEFEILFTCYDTATDFRLRELNNFGFTKNEIKNLKTSLREFTNNLIRDFPKLFDRFNQSYEKLTRNREKCVLELANSKKNYSDYLLAAQKLLTDCRKYGIIPFSAVARIAFIGTAILRGLKSNSVLEPEIFDDFLSSITTPLSEFKNEIGKFVDGVVSKKYFLEKYGHLRPGTYDITIPRYDKNQDYLKNIKFPSKNKSKKMSKINEKRINEILENHQLKFKEVTFLEFLRQSVTQRENLKFEFTKNLSQALEYIAIAGEKLGFSREEMSNLEFSDIMKFSTKNRQHLVSTWKKKSDRKNMVKKLNEYFLLPSIIFSEDDFQVIRSYVAKPNYITKKRITANVLILNPKNKIPNIENKIVIIENADPGYDWIFAKNPKGLITKYGGIASHMAIRCGEIGMPAVIGCGEMLFEKLKIAEKLSLDCKNEKINIIEYNKEDDYLEERKLLKSLGYIK
jgi:phosphohistidine swiveling domain-containing protein